MLTTQPNTFMCSAFLLWLCCEHLQHVRCKIEEVVFLISRCFLYLQRVFSICTTAVVVLLTCFSFSMSEPSPMLLPGLVLREEAKHTDLQLDLQTLNSRTQGREARRTCSTEPQSQETPGSCPDP